MVTIVAYLLFLIFISLAAIHFYWGFGGLWGSGAVFPIKSNDMPPIMPGSVPTFIVALGLLTIALFILLEVGFVSLFIPSWVNEFGLWMIAGIFILRSIGEFKYVGFFKKIKHTAFGEMDTKYYSPLCLIIGVLTILLAVVSIR